MKIDEIDLFRFPLVNLQVNSWEEMESALQYLRQIDGVEIAPVARNSRSVFRRWFQSPLAAGWLSSESGVSMKHAAEIIRGFPIPVAPRMDQNAMNPRCFLGIASAFARNPEAVVFSTAGMDPRGFKLLHAYAMQQFNGTLVHLDISVCKTCRSIGQSYSIGS